MKHLVLGLLLLLNGYCSAVLAQHRPQTALQLAQHAHQRGTYLYSQKNPTAQVDSESIANFKQVISLLPRNRANAPLLFDSQLKLGIFAHTYEQPTNALQYYRQAIQLGRQFALRDSLLFKPYIYAGGIFQDIYEVDSAIHYCKKAEQLYERYPEIEDNRRLFNQLGMIYQSAGDYRQSINYYQKALQLLQRRTTEKQDPYVRYTNNMAIAYLRLGQYDRAIALFKGLLPLNIDKNYLLLNLGTIYIEKKEPQQALGYLLAVKNLPGNWSVKLANPLARSYLLLGQTDLAIKQLNEGLNSYRKQHEARKSVDVGVTYRLLGDIAMQKNQYEKALGFYQQAIIQQHYTFNNKQIAQNPEQFTEGFNHFVLFETLAAKATCLEALLARQPTPATLEMTLGAYRSVLALANHIQKSLDTEESRLFTLKKVYPLHQRAVMVLVRAYEQTRDERLLEAAFQCSEQSKASVLYIGRKENESKANAGIPDSLLQQERNLRFGLSQLFVQLDAATTDRQIAQIRATIRDKELALSRLANRLNDYPDYFRKKFGADTLDLSYLRRSVLGSNTALVSFFQTPTTLYTFLLTRDELTLRKLPITDTFRKAVVSFAKSIRTVEAGVPYKGSLASQHLYRMLLKPLESEISKCKSLIIIPHNELNQVPFEALENDKQLYLIERFAVSYQYSASFLTPEPLPKLRKETMLAVAPFGGTEPLGSFALLPGSEGEISELEGTKLIRAGATKAKFLQVARQASVIHLATHALANNDEPSRSYIAFYPCATQDNKLYAHELQYGALAQARLLYLSACETADGRLVKGEGVMSLSRALSYAGCANLITSLWKAEDSATAYISQQFYEHLADGYSIDWSLQKAKLDLLRNPKLAQFHAPPYWAHLLFIGSPPNPGISGERWWLGGLAILLASGGWWLFSKRTKKDHRNIQ
ncbi:MAG: CHAT domain-containing protein [Cytophagales bacterium]|nr:MAG: CHAT domain-containing protein [Cytophagales bacterium]